MNININEGDLVYIDVMDNERPALCAICRYIGKKTFKSSDIKLNVVETQDHGIVYIDPELSNLKKFKC